MQYLYVSYPPEDYDFAHRLVDDLQNAGYLVFVDAVRGAGSLGWAGETRRAIDQCGAVILILSLADPRPTGIRHEGIVSNRKGKPVFVAARSAGSLPRYLSDAAVIDFSADYEEALSRLLAALPNAIALAAADTRPRVRRRVNGRASSHRRWQVGVILLLALGLALGIVLGVIPV